MATTQDVGRLAVIVHADARALPLRDGSVQMVCTSPPYWGLRSYLPDGHDDKHREIGLEPTPDAYVASLVAVFREVRRVLKDDGVLWLNLGDSYAHSLRQSGAAHAGPKQNTSQGTIRRGFAPLPSGLREKDLVGIPWRVAFALQADGWWLRQDIIWSKSNPMPESVTDRCTKAHEYLFLLTKSARYFWDAEAMQEPLQTPPHAPGNKAREGVTMQTRHRQGKSTDPSADPTRIWAASGKRNRRSVWTIPTQPYAGAHFAVMPEKLVEPCVLAASRPGDLVLDPFCGSGTVMRTAYRLARKGVGCDLNLAYLDLATERTHVTYGLPL